MSAVSAIHIQDLDSICHVVMYCSLASLVVLLDTYLQDTMQKAVHMLSYLHHVVSPMPASIVLHVQPLKCLCGSALCRGFIGGKEVANRTADPR